MADATLMIQSKIDLTETRIADLESKVGGADDMYLADKINYHLGVLSGLRQAKLMLEMEDV